MVDQSEHHRCTAPLNNCSASSINWVMDQSIPNFNHPNLRCNDWHDNRDKDFEYATTAQIATWHLHRLGEKEDLAYFGCLKVLLDNAPLLHETRDSVSLEHSTTLFQTVNSWSMTIRSYQKWQPHAKLNLP